MQRIEQPCPHCAKRLKIDPGFIGSICRCKYCGALISVSKKAGTVRLKLADQTVFGQELARERRADAPAARDVSPASRSGPDDTLPPGSPVIDVEGQPRPTGPVPTVSGSGSPWHRPEIPAGAKPKAPPPTPGFVERHQALLIALGVIVLVALIGAAVWAIRQNAA